MEPSSLKTNVLRVEPPDQLICNGHSYQCALGRGGIRSDKREGDGATPVGCFSLRRLFFRPDRLAAPGTELILQALKPEDGWCDDPTHSAYNKLVVQPFPASHEPLWRNDDIYDLIVEIGFNDNPIRAGHGSAIFMHIAKPGYEATEGCVALHRSHLLEVIRGCGPKAIIVIPSPN